ncbi:MAG: ATP-dependent helicase [Candidatus Dormibacteria bacterium]
MTEIQDSLSDEQRRVVEAPLGTARKVVAGAGTGKTKTMVERFAHLVSPVVGLDAGRIMVVTFTNKAAAELRERITAKLLSTGQAEERASLDNAWIGTFHALCTRLLREDCYQVGFDRDIQVIDPLEERLLIQEIQGELRDGRIENARILQMEAIDVDDIARLSNATFDLIRSLKSRGILPKELHERCITASKAFWDAIKVAPNTDVEIGRLGDEEARELVCATYAAYEDRLKGRSLIDFDGILVATRDALRDHRGWAQERREFFQHLIVDEFQDTNTLQLEVLRSLAQPSFSNLEVVGDPRQSIYGWRDAEIENILKFEGEEHLLTENYRSPQPILDAAHHIISQDSRFLEGPLRAYHGAGSEESVSLYRADSPDDEARFVAGRILQLHEDDSVAWSDIAILTRMRRPPIAFEKELRRLGIPYVTGGGYGFFEREEIKDVMAFVRLIDDPLDDAALIRALQGPVVRVTDGDLFRLFNGRRDGQHSWDLLQERMADSESAIEPATRARVEKAIRLVADGQDRRGGMSISQLLQWVLDATEYPAIAAADPSAAARRMGNLRKLYRMAAEYESSAAFSGLREFIEYVELHGEHGVDVGEAESEGADAVSFMTIHAAKGLEFPVVFLAHLKPFYNGGERWMMRYDEGLGLVVRKLDDNETSKMIALRTRGAEAMPLHREKEEMRRLVYVAMTRAMTRLFVTATRKEESDWDAVLADNEPKGTPRKLTEDDYFRNLALWASGASDSLLAPVNGERRAWKPLHPTTAAAEMSEALPTITDPQETRKPDERLQLSFSAMEVFLQCPLRYRYRQEWKIPAPPDGLRLTTAGADAAPTVSASQLGTLIHAALEAFHEPGPTGGTGGIDRLSQIWTALCSDEISSAAAEKLWASRVEEMMERYLASEVATWPTLATEQEFNLAYDGAVIRGFIDRLAQPPGSHTTVIDYKTGDPGVSAAYGMQLEIYKAAMAAMQVNADAILYSLQQASPLSPGTGDSPASVLGRIRDGDRSVGDSPPCLRCAYRGSCTVAPGWGERAL